MEDEKEEEEEEAKQPLPANNNNTTRKEKKKRMKKNENKMKKKKKKKWKGFSSSLLMRSLDDKFNQQNDEENVDDHKQSSSSLQKPRMVYARRTTTKKKNRKTMKLSSSLPETTRRRPKPNDVVAGELNNRRKKKKVKTAEENTSAITAAGSDKKKKRTREMNSRRGSDNDDGDDDDNGISRGAKRRRRRRRRRKSKRRISAQGEDEVFKLKRRTKNLLIKMRLEQNLIDAYSGEGWKGQSREKIRPERELMRAEEQILKCKLAIRDALHHLHLLSSAGQIADSVMDHDGSVYHEHIFCAICKRQDTSPDNDIILCDGPCNCAYHQKCLDPPLATENIPPGDEGWLCKYCDCKMDILDVINAYLGTNFSIDSSWEDIFKEEAITSDGNTSLKHQLEWPSDDSEDDDYDPNKNEGYPHRHDGHADADSDGMEHTGTSSSSVWFTDGSNMCSDSPNVDDSSLCGLNQLGGRRDTYSSCELTNSDNSYDHDFVTYGRRQRGAVDYRKLNDEMFGKGFSGDEILSEDEDWGPRSRRKRKHLGTTIPIAPPGEEASIKELSVGTDGEKVSPTGMNGKRRVFRIPPKALEELRRAFAENELPSRLYKRSLSEKLCIPYEKVNKWFKNARYASLKLRKVSNSTATPIKKKNRGSKHGLCELNGSISKWNAREAPQSEAALLHSLTMLEDIFRLEGKIDVLKGVLRSLSGEPVNAKKYMSNYLEEVDVMYIPVVEVREKPK